MNLRPHQKIITVSESLCSLSVSHSAPVKITQTFTQRAAVRNLP